MQIYTYLNHVMAARITSITQASDGSAILGLDGTGTQQWVVAPCWIRRNNPQVGGYLVVYESGLTSFFETNEFERKFRLKGGR